MKFRGEKNGRNRIGTRRIWDRDYRSDSSRPHLLTAGTHRGVTMFTCTEEARRPDEIRRTHPSRRSFGTARRIWKTPEATWAQPLGPGRAVLTGGVSRRSGSVACVHADASPTEVLAALACTATRRSSNVHLFFVSCGRPRPSRPAICRHGLVIEIPWRDTHPGGLLSLVCLQLCRILESSRCSTGCTPSPKPRCRGCAGCTISWIDR